MSYRGIDCMDVGVYSKKRKRNILEKTESNCLNFIVRGQIYNIKYRLLLVFNKILQRTTWLNSSGEKLNVLKKTLWHVIYGTPMCPRLEWASLRERGFFNNLIRNLRDNATRQVLQAYVMHYRTRCLRLPFVLLCKTNDSSG